MVKNTTPTEMVINRILEKVYSSKIIKLGYLKLVVVMNLVNRP